MQSGCFDDNDERAAAVCIYIFGRRSQLGISANTSTGGESKCVSASAGWHCAAIRLGCAARERTRFDAGEGCRL
jgi:hypothetical protein